MTCAGKGNGELGDRNDLRGKQKTLGFRMGRDLCSFTKNHSEQLRWLSPDKQKQAGKIHRHRQAGEEPVHLLSWPIHS